MEPSNNWLECREWPDHLTAEILAWLPLPSLCRFRCVCKEWNALISSTQFIATQWAKKPPNRNPCLILQWVIFNETDFKIPNPVAYCFFTQTWKKTPSICLSFMLQQGLETTYPIMCCGSAAGLYLVKSADPCDIIVCNPLTRTSLQQLPCLSAIWYIDMIGIVGGDGDNRDTYKVVAVGKSKNPDESIVEIFNSSEKSWRIAGHVPEGVITAGRGTAREMEMVFCDGSFYCLIFINGEWGIMGFNIREGTSVSASLPEITQADCHPLQLIACGSRILIAGGVFEDEDEYLQFIIWEFQKAKGDSSSPFSPSRLKEIARMPPSFRERVSRDLFLVDYPCPVIGCVVGDCACFVFYELMPVIEVAVYSVSQKTWSWLPSCPLEDSCHDGDDIWPVSVMAFEPRPDMKVR